MDARPLVDVTEEVLAEYAATRDNLIPVLQDLQARIGYLPEPALRRVASSLDLSPHDVYGVATFYAQFRFTKPGKHCLKICEGTACHVRGSRLLLEQLCGKLGIEPGQVTGDGELGLERVMCLGSCALAPAVVLDEAVVGRVTEKKLSRLLAGNSHAADGNGSEPADAEGGP